MSKNEFGYPAGCGFCRCVAESGNGCTESRDTCGGNTAVDGLEPAYLYAPTQKFCMLYSASDALAHGTLFEQLYKPMEVYGRE